MIRAPMAIAEFTIRNLAPLLTPKINPEERILVSNRIFGEVYMFLFLTVLRGRGIQRSWMTRHHHGRWRRGTRGWCTCPKEQTHEFPKKKEV